MKRWVKHVFQTLKMRKKNQLKHINQVPNGLLIDRKVFEYEGLYLSLRGEHMNDKRLH